MIVLRIHMQQVFIVTMGLFYIGNLHAAWYQTAYKAVEKLWTPPSAPTITSKTLAAALQEHKTVQKQTNYWFLPTRSAIAGSLTAAATFLLGTTLRSHDFAGLLPKHPVLAATTAGLLCTAGTLSLLRRHNQIVKRRHQQEELSIDIEILNDPTVVLERQSLLASYKQTLNRWYDECEQKYYASLTNQANQPSPDEQRKIDRAYQLLKRSLLDHAEERIDWCTFRSKEWEEIKDIGHCPQSCLDITFHEPDWQEHVARIKEQCLREGIETAIVDRADSLLQEIIRPIETWSPNSLKNCVELNRVMLRLYYALVPH